MQTGLAARHAGKHWQALSLNGHELLNKCAVLRRTDALLGAPSHVGYLLTQLWGHY